MEGEGRTAVDGNSVAVQLFGAAGPAAVVGEQFAAPGARVRIAPGGDAAAVVLVDPRPGDWEAATATRLPIVLLTVEPLGADAMLAAVMRGADAVLDMATAPSAIAAAVHTVVAGGMVLSATFTRRLADAVRVAAGDGRPLTLTRREREILLSIEDGSSVKHTAVTLGISPKTVENLQTRMFRKLGVRNRAQAAALARALGLLGASEAVETAAADI